MNRLLKTKDYGCWIILLLILFILSASGCGTMPVKDNSDARLQQAQEADYINNAVLVFAADIEDRGWELNDYMIETGDVLNIEIWQVEDLKETVVVRPDGKISFPLIGDVQAKGVTIQELKASLELKLSKYIRTPQASVIVEAFGGKRAIVIDESGGGGIIRFTEPIRVVEALAMAGGYNANVNLHKVYVIRGSMERGRPTQIIVVNAHRIFREGNMSENILVYSDDIIFLARGWLSTTVDFVAQLQSLKNQIHGVIGQANYYRNVDNIVPWRTKTMDIDLSKNKSEYTKGSWGTNDIAAD